MICILQNIHVPESLFVYIEFHKHFLNYPDPQTLNLNVYLRKLVLKSTKINRSEMARKGLK